jgi:hypothetical protein
VSWLLFFGFLFILGVAFVEIAIAPVGFLMDKELLVILSDDGIPDFKDVNSLSLKEITGDLAKSKEEISKAIANINTGKAQTNGTAQTVAKDGTVITGNGGNVQGHTTMEANVSDNLVNKTTADIFNAGKK